VSGEFTFLGDRLNFVKAHTKVTLSLPEPLLRRFRVYAASRNESMTSLMVKAIRALMDGEPDREKAKRRFLGRLTEGRNLGTHGKIPWGRGEIHER